MKFARNSIIVNGYLANRQQRIKLSGSFSCWKSVTRGVPQGSVLRPLLFNIYINDLLLFVQNSEICNYADDTIIYACNENLDYISHRLENEFSISLERFADNFMKLSVNKCHLLVVGKDVMVLLLFRTGNANVVNSCEEKLLGVQIDSKLSFYNNVSKLPKG